MTKILLAMLILFSVASYSQERGVTGSLVIPSMKVQTVSYPNITYSDDLKSLMKAAHPFMCHVGKFKIIKLKQTGEFNKFSLEGTGTLINTSGITPDIAANTNIEYMVASSDSYIAVDKYIHVYCSKALSLGDKGPASIDFYVE